MHSDEPEATTDISKKIKTISKEAIHQICSGQVKIICINFSYYGFPFLIKLRIYQVDWLER